MTPVKISAVAFQDDGGWIAQGEGAFVKAIMNPARALASVAALFTFALALRAALRMVG